MKFINAGLVIVLMNMSIPFYKFPYMEFFPILNGKYDDLHSTWY